MAKPKTAKTLKETEARSYDLRLSYDPRVSNVLLGEKKYTTPARALAELIANSLDAGATTVSVAFEEDALGGASKILIRDNGRGILPDDIRHRIAVVGVLPPTDPGINAGRMGQFGIGRLAVHRLGDVSTWTTTAKLQNGERVRSSFTLTSDRPDLLQVTETPAGKSASTGTLIEIEEIKEGQQAGLFPSRVTEELLSQFCGYLLAHPERRIEVQGEALDTKALVQEQELETLTDLPREVGTVTMRHVSLTRTVDRTRIPHQVMLTAKGRTVKGLDADVPLSANYIGLAEAPYLEKIVTSNREAIIEFDPNLAAICDRAVATAVAYDERRLAQRQARFIESARQLEYYPYRNAPGDSVSFAQQAVYDIVLERIHESANLDSMSKRQQAVVFKLLKRALENEDMMAVLGEVATLSDEDVEKFRKVLERTTLDSIIKLSSEVTGRIQFLDYLHTLVYDDLAKHVKERSQLHKLLESKAWLFGPRFHLATSDKSFREVIRRHRQMADLPAVADDVLKLVKGGSDIPDLFLAATKEYPSDTKHNHLLVELKAPSVKIGNKELAQLRKYATTITESSEFDKRSTSWDIYLVSSEVSTEIKHDRQSPDRPFGCVLKWEGLTGWAFQWSEVITEARDEMQLVRQHLQKRSQELSVSDYLRDEFPELVSLADAMKEAS